MRLSLAVLWLMAPVALSAQDPRLLDRLPRPTAVRIGQLVDSARSEGLPPEPLILRALEGASKGADEVRIVAVLDRLRDALRTARSTLGTTASADDITIAAAALQAGVPGTRVAELRRWRGDQPLTVPLGAYLDLLARGVPEDRAWTQVSELARRRATDRDYVGLASQRVIRPLLEER